MLTTQLKSAFIPKMTKFQAGLAAAGTAGAFALSKVRAKNDEYKNSLETFSEEILYLERNKVANKSVSNGEMLNNVLNDCTAKMSYDTYNPKIQQIHGMKQTGIYENKQSGFKAVTYSDGAEIIIAYSGSHDLMDFVCDIQMMLGKVPYQYKDALNLYQKIKSENPDKEITLTGHSLGGSLAQLVASANKDVAAVTYNAFGTDRIMKNNNKYGFKNNNNNCYNYVIKGDIVSNCSEQVGKTVCYNDIKSFKHFMHGYMNRWA